MESKKAIDNIQKALTYVTMIVFVCGAGFAFGVTMTVMLFFPTTFTKLYALGAYFAFMGAVITFAVSFKEMGRKK